MHTTNGDRRCVDPDGRTNTLTNAIIALVSVFVLGFVFVWLVPVRRAIEAAGNRPPAVL